jgi:hypothetical protein
MGATLQGFEMRRGLFWRADRPLSRAAAEFSARLQAEVARLMTGAHPVIREIDPAKYSLG